MIFLFLFTVLFANAQQTPYERVRGSPYSVGYDARAILINGERILQHVATVHYPRATPEQWPGIMKRSRDAGINTIQSYVFWNMHEEENGVFDFTTDSRDLVRFLRECADAGMFVNLRIGPYVNAERNLGGIPSWLLEIPDIVFRTYDEAWLFYMERFVREVYSLVEANGLLATAGGPIMMLQIENEYGHHMHEYGEGGVRYVEWMTELTHNITTDVPWIVCGQDEAPLEFITAINGHYVIPTVGRSRRQPGLWTEHWLSWFQHWGEAFHNRAVEDVAYAIARFFQYGGSYQSYYLWFGGTTFGRSSGEMVNVDYTFGGQLNPLGFRNEPMYSHHGALNHAMTRFSEAFLSVDQDPPTQNIGCGNCEAVVYGTLGEPGTLVFLANNAGRDQTARFNGYIWDLPAKSISLVDGEGGSPDDIVYNTATVQYETEPAEERVVPTEKFIRWTEEPVGGFEGSGQIVNETPLTQVPLTHDHTDYLWYSTIVNITQTESTLRLENTKHWVVLFLDGELVEGSLGGEWYSSEKYFEFPTTVGQHLLEILSVSMGFHSYGAFLERVFLDRGLNGPVIFNGEDIRENTWNHHVGLKGELLQFYNPDPQVIWNIGPETGRPMTWYEIEMTMPKPSEEQAYAMLMTSMSKGNVWVNGHHLGRFWDIIGEGNCSPCDYRDTYNMGNMCMTHCGDPTQSLYHLPRDWMVSEGGLNRVVVFTELGGDPEGVQLVETDETESPF